MNNVQYGIDAPVLEGADVSMFEGTSPSYEPNKISESIFANVNESTSNSPNIV